MSCVEERLTETKRSSLGNCSCQAKGLPPPAAWQKAELYDKAGIFRNWNEFGRRNSAAPRVFPTHQCLKARNRAFLQLHNGLVNKADFVALQCPAQVGFKLKLVAADGAEGGPERLDAVAAETFGLEHCKFRILDKIFCRGRSLGPGDEANGGRQHDLTLGIGNGRAHGLAKCFRKGCDAARIDFRGKQQAELVGGKARKRILRLHEAR